MLTAGWLVLLAQPALAAPPKPGARASESESDAPRRRKARKKRPKPASKAPVEEAPAEQVAPVPTVAPQPEAPVDDGSDRSESIDLDASGDVSESIDLGSDATSGQTPAAAPEHPTLVLGDQLEFRLRGWARVRGSATVRGDDGDDVGVQVPFEPAQGDSQLLIELRVQKNRRYEALVSGLLWYTLASHREETATLIKTSPRGLFEPSLREAYVGMILPRFLVRLGQQRLAWGNSDAFPINDVINPRDLRDPLITEVELQRIPTMAARLDFTFEDLSITLALMPFFVPDRLDVYGTNWSFVGPRAPAGIRGAFGQLNDSVDPTLREPNQLLMRQTSLPPDDFSATAIGLRASLTVGGVDLTPNYHFGYTTAPELRIDPALAQYIASIDWTTATPEQVAPLLAARGTDDLSATYRRRHHAGLSVTTTAGSFVVRGEGAYESAQVFYEPTLLSVVRPTLQGVVGVEYQPGEVGKAIILEAMALHLLGDPTPVLLGADSTTYGAAAILRWTFWEHLECELRAVGSFQPLGMMLRPQIAYKHGPYELRGGLVWLDGEDTSRERYFLRTSSAYLVGKAQF